MNTSSRSKPMVSVVMITYKHEKYIAAAIKGVLMQKCDFDLELIIADDNSPDNTEHIVSALREECDENRVIHYTKHTDNKGMNANFIWALSYSSGKYIAICEGDDYWTDPLKLQKQIDYLDKNYNITLCFHRAQKIKDNKLVSSSFEGIESRKYSGNDLLLDTFIPTASVVFRNDINEDYGYIINSEIIYPDIFVWLKLLERGPAFCLPRIMSCYRVQENSVTNVAYTEGNIKKIICNYKILNETLNFKYTKTINLILHRNYLKITKMRLKVFDMNALYSGLISLKFYLFSKF